VRDFVIYATFSYNALCGLTSRSLCPCCIRHGLYLSRSFTCYRLVKIWQLTFSVEVGGPGCKVGHMGLARTSSNL